MHDNKYNSADLKAAQSMPLDAKVGRTLARIMEFYQHYDGKVYVSFSGGKDSTVLLYLVRQLYPDVPAVFANTGLEYPEIVEFVKTFDNVETLRPKTSFKRVIEEHGYPVVSKEVSELIRQKRAGQRYAVRRFNEAKRQGDRFGIYKSYGQIRKWGWLENAPFKISEKCCDMMKKQTAHRYEKESGRHPFLGTMADESLLRRQAWMRNGCNAFNSQTPKSTPMAFWTEQDVLEYILAKNIPIAPIYGEIVRGKDGKLKTTGAHRTGCMFCLFGIHHEKQPNRIQQLYYTHPKIYDYILDKMGFRDVMDYMHIPYEPVPDLFMEL